jgi:hypothetical protein
MANVPYVPNTPELNQYITTTEFNSRYYAGADVNIFFNDTWLDEVVNIQYQIVENTMPFFGYASYTWNTVAKGSRSIQGSFTINFKKAGYLLTLLKEFKSGNQIIPPAESYTSHLDNTTSNIRTAEDFIRATLGKDGTDTAKMVERGRAQVEKYWNRVVANTSVKDNTALFDTGRDGFTIFIKYGDAGKHEGTQKSNTFSLSSAAESPIPEPVSTEESLIDVHITGTGKVIDDGGKGILEVYQFISRDIVPL